MWIVALCFDFKGKAMLNGNLFYTFMKEGGVAGYWCMRGDDFTSVRGESFLKS